MFKPHKFNKNILRAYDIRGIVKETLNDIDAERLGNIFASSFGNESKKIIVYKKEKSNNFFSLYFISYFLFKKYRKN